jgi:cell wall-associated NlpC family hydrolase|tara:strand:+ start:132 stop:869 length:738 start_codon:yes stop_codon:yes gene_type:complete
MNRFFSNIYSVTNLYKRMSTKSEIVTQMIYGDSFSIIKKTKKWLKIKITEDNYKGYIQNRKFNDFIEPTHKVHVLKAKIYKLPNKKKINELPFGSKIKAVDKKSQFIKFQKGWVNQKDLVPTSYKEKDIFKKIGIFKNVKYKWGGKSFKGIDCSALIQVCINFNNKFCPRDTKNQVRYFKKNVKLKKIKKNDIIYWQGHVAVALSKSKLIHAYGPRKKTIQMDINKTIKIVKNTANLKVIGIKRI